MKYLYLFFFFIFMGKICADLTGELYDKARNFQNEKQYTKAKDLFLKAADLEMKTNSAQKTHLGMCLYRAGNCFYQLENYDKALEYYKKAEDKLAGTPMQGTLFNDMGIYYYRVRQDLLALQYYNKALKILGENAEVLCNVGVVHKAQHEYEKAQKYYLRAIKVEKKAANIATYLNNMSILYLNLGNFSQAYEYASKALKLRKQLGTKFEAESLNEIGFLHHYCGDYKKALEFFSQALNKYQTLAEENVCEEISMLWNNVGTSYTSLGDYKKALECFAVGIKIDLKYQLFSREATKYKNIGYVYFLKSDYKKALKYTERALDILSRVGLLQDKPSILNNKAMILRALENYDEAMLYLKQAWKIELQLKKDSATTENNIASLEQDRGNFVEALALYEKAIKKQQQQNRRYEMAVTWKNIGNLYQVWGKYDLALETYDKVREISKTLGKSEIADVELSYGNVFYLWGKYDLALDHLHKALKIYQQIGQKLEEGISYSDIALVYKHLGQNEKSYEYFEKSLDIARKNGYLQLLSSALNGAATLFLNTAPHKTEKYYLEAIAISKQQENLHGLVNGYNNIGYFLAKVGQTNKARTFFIESLNLATKLNIKPAIADALHNLGSISSLEKNYGAAIDYLKQSVLIKEELRKTATIDVRKDYLAKEIHTYQHLIHCFIQNKDFEGAYNIFEQSRAKVLREKILQNISFDEYNLVTPIEQVRKQLHSKSAVVIFTEVQKNKLIAMLITNNKQIKVTEINILEYAELAKYQDTKKIAQQLDGHSKVSTRGTKKIWHEKEYNGDYADEKPILEGAIKYYRQTIQNLVAIHSMTNKHQKEQKLLERDIRIKKIAQELYKVFITPIEQELTKINELIIIPDGIISYLPFSSLLDAQGNYLLEKYSIRYCQSVSLLEVLNKRQYSEKRKDLMVFANPEYQKTNTSHFHPSRISKEQLFKLTKEVEEAVQQGKSRRHFYAPAIWQNLPGAEKIKNISQILPESDIITGKNASEENIKSISKLGKLKNYRMLHFGLHGTIDMEISLLSALVLAQFENFSEDDGYLCIDEIQLIKLEAEFVNLSACDTNLGKIYPGEGVANLVQSFYIAGAKSVGATLWEVEDNSTAEFMATMYHFMAQGERCDVAIAKTQHQFIHSKWKDPFFWAPFTFYGNSFQIRKKTVTDIDYLTWIVFITSIIIVCATYLLWRDKQLQRKRSLHRRRKQ